MVPSMSLVLLPSSVMVAPTAAEAGALSLTIGALFGLSLAMAIGALPPKIRLTTTTATTGRDTPPRTRPGERNTDKFGPSPTMLVLLISVSTRATTVVRSVRITHASHGAQSADGRFRARHTSPVSNHGWIRRAGLGRIASRGVASTDIDSADGRPDARR